MLKKVVISKSNKKALEILADLDRKKKELREKIEKKMIEQNASISKRASK
ncbi:hypothetical protein [Taibaiella soli]|nr:hypothetical protein [Taibaiella soli]